MHQTIFQEREIALAICCLIRQASKLVVQFMQTFFSLWGFDVIWIFLKNNLEQKKSSVRVSNELYAFDHMRKFRLCLIKLNSLLIMVSSLPWEPQSSINFLYIIFRKRNIRLFCSYFLNIFNSEIKFIKINHFKESINRKNYSNNKSQTSSNSFSSWRPSTDFRTFPLFFFASIVLKSSDRCTRYG